MCAVQGAFTRLRHRYCLQAGRQAIEWKRLESLMAQASGVRQHLKLQFLNSSQNNKTCSPQAGKFSVCDSCEIALTIALICLTVFHGCIMVVAFYRRLSIIYRY